MTTIKQIKRRIEREMGEITYGAGEPKDVYKFCEELLDFIRGKREPDLPGIEDPGIPGKDYIPTDWVNACEQYGIWEIVRVAPETSPEYPLTAVDCSDGRFHYVGQVVPAGVYVGNPQEVRRLFRETFKDGEGGGRVNHKEGREMKAKDLMIGDLVTFKDCLNDGKILPVEILALGYQHNGEEDEALVAIDGDNAGDIIGLDDEVVGIPLTPEFLEKNGWYRNCCYSSNEVDFELMPYEDGSFGISVPADEYGSGVFAHIMYVHELQHALRLAGIDKEIVL